MPLFAQPLGLASAGRPSLRPESARRPPRLASGHSQKAARTGFLSAPSPRSQKAAAILFTPQGRLWRPKQIAPKLQISPRRGSSPKYFKPAEGRWAFDHDSSAAPVLPSRGGSAVLPCAVPLLCRSGSCLPGFWPSAEGRAFCCSPSQKAAPAFWGHW